MAAKDWKNDKNFYRGGTIIFRNVETNAELFISKEHGLWAVSVDLTDLDKFNTKSDAVRAARAYMGKH